MALVGIGLDRKRELHDAKADIDALDKTFAEIERKSSNVDSLTMTTVKQKTRVALKRKRMVYRINESSIIVVMLVNLLVALMVVALLKSQGVVNADGTESLFIIALVITFAGIFLSKAIRSWVELQEIRINKQLLMLSAELRQPK